MRILLNLCTALGALGEAALPTDVSATDGLVLAAEVAHPVEQSGSLRGDAPLNSTVELVSAGCVQCCQTGNCYMAYAGQMGRCCSSQAYSCCPLQSGGFAYQCVAAGYQQFSCGPTSGYNGGYNGGYSGTPYGGYGYGYSHTYTYRYRSSGGGDIVFAFILFFCFVMCFCRGNSSGPTVTYTTGGNYQRIGGETTYNSGGGGGYGRGYGQGGYSDGGVMAAGMTGLAVGIVADELMNERRYDNYGPGYGGGGFVDGGFNGGYAAPQLLPSDGGGFGGGMLPSDGGGFGGGMMGADAGQAMYMGDGGGGGFLPSDQ